MDLVSNAFPCLGRTAERFPVTPHVRDTNPPICARSSRSRTTCVILAEPISVHRVARGQDIVRCRVVHFGFLSENFVGEIAACENGLEKLSSVIPGHGLHKVAYSSKRLNLFSQSHRIGPQWILDQALYAHNKNALHWRRLPHDMCAQPKLARMFNAFYL